MDLIKMLSDELDAWHELQSQARHLDAGTRMEVQRMCRIAGNMLLGAMLWMER